MMGKNMDLQEQDRTIATLAVIGAVIAIGKLLTGGEKITARLIIGRIIVGAGLSVAASSVLMLFPDLPLMAITGLGAAFGILGQSYLELIVQRWFNKRSNQDVD